MKAITVKQPWASLIVEGTKDVENRSWKCPEKYIGQRVLIHADAERKNGRHLNYGTLTDQQIEDAISKLSNKATCLYDAFLFNGNTNRIFSAIIGSVEIVDCVINHESIWAEKTIDCNSGCPDAEKCPIGKCPHRIYNWVLANPIKFTNPIPCKGKLRFWESEFEILECAKCGKYTLHDNRDISVPNFGNPVCECSNCGYIMLESEFQYLK